MHHFQARQTAHIEVFVDFLTYRAKQYKSHQQAVY